MSFKLSADDAKKYDTELAKFDGSFVYEEELGVQKMHH